MALMSYRPAALLAALAALLPLCGQAQRLAESHPPVYYHVGPLRAPLYRTPDTLQKPSKFLPSQSVAHVVGEISPRWVVVKEQGFLYLTAAAALADYDPADALAPPLDASTHRIAYQGVVQVPGTTQADLLARARAWVAKTYDQQSAQLTRDDAASGQLQLQGTQLAHVYQDFQGIPRRTYAGVVHYALSIYVKDGRYKYVLTDFVHEAQNSPTLRSGGPLEAKRASLYGYAGLGSFENWSELKTEALRNARALVASLEEAMTLQKPQSTRSASDF